MKHPFYSVSIDDIPFGDRIIAILLRTYLVRCEDAEQKLAAILSEGIVLKLPALVKKQKMQRHNYVILTGQLAKLVIAAALIILLSCMVSPAVYTALCISMGLCAVICLISGVLNGGMMFRKLKPSQHAWRGIYTLCCFFVSGFVVYFELFNFWA